MGSFVTGLFEKIQEQTKALVFVFVFCVLVDEQAIRLVHTELFKKEFWKELKNFFKNSRNFAEKLEVGDCCGKSS